ncbi:hypothetical protein D9758_002742 [Tetrapyrgos nigripes]|uniref:Uncharacterized protein n=1 Tax=Tetrapyrgos nigripes TaxID=182062 RepID=A0A8H5LTC9_9AGAR|nr:hypothetical protein D9758_002742 [Tetrapyrgos nigripes]
MDQLRRRIPFRAEDNGEDENTVLDESEQEELIQRLKKQNETLNTQYQLAMQVIIALSAFIHLVYLFNPTEEPLLFFFPSSLHTQTGSKPLPRPFTLLSLIVHCNLFLRVHLGAIHNSGLQMRIGDFHLNLHPLPYSISYALALVAPTVCLFFGRSWLTAAWWSVTLGIVFTAQTMQDAIISGNEGISALEKLRYTAPGA